MRRAISALIIKKILVIFVMISMLVQQQQSHAQALPVANFVMNRAVAGVVTRVAAARGFAANDPKIAATLTGMGTVSTGLNVASSVAGVGMAVMGAPVWMSVLAGLGVIGLGMALTGSLDSKSMTMSIASTSNGNKLLVDAPTPAEPTYNRPTLADQTPRWSQAVSQGAPIYRSASACYSNELCYALPLPPDIPSYRYVADTGGKTLLVTTNLNTFGWWYTFLTDTLTMNQNTPGVTYTWQFSGAQLVQNSSGDNQITVSIYEARSGGDASGLPSYSRTDTFNNVGYVYGSIGPAYYGDLNSAYTGMAQGGRDAKISANSLANIVNAEWQRAAAQPGYSGMPYSATQPVTFLDAQQWIDANPTAVPTFNDLLTPASNPGSTTVVISPTVTPGTDTGTTPGTNPSTGVGTDVNVVNTPNVNVVNQVSVDLGPNPGIGSPSLESTPTAQMILQPLLDLFPSLRNFIVPSHSSECPKPSFDLFGKSIVMDTHCTLLESVRPTLYAVMAFVWVAIAMFIVLAA